MSATAAPEDTLLLELASGTVTIELLPDLAPKHVEQIRTLARRGFYDGTPFHRVIEGFMAQGGDPTGTGTGGSDLPDIPAEFSPPARARFQRGTCGMARTMNPDSANSQFFIMFAPAPSLDGQYTIWGRVTAGMEHVDRIKRGAGANGMVREPDRVKSLKVAADVAPPPAPVTAEPAAVFPSGAEGNAAAEDAAPAPDAPAPDAAPTPRSEPPSGEGVDSTPGGAV